MADSIEYSVGVIWGLLKRITLSVGVVALSVYVLYECRSILVSVIIAIFLTYALLPAVQWMCRERIPWLTCKTQRLLATIVVFLVFFVLVSVSVALFVAPFHSEMKDLSKNVTSYVSHLHEWFGSATHWYHRYVPKDVQSVVRKLDWTKMNAQAGEWVKGIWTKTTSWIGYVLELILIPVLAFYFVWDYRTLTREIYGLVPRRRLREAVRIGHDVGEILQSYVIGQFILCLIAGVLTGLVLWALGVPYALVLAILAGVTRAIPVIGPVVSGIPIVLVGMVNSQGGVGLPIALLVFVVIMHLAESKFIMPRLIGERMNLHPAVVIIVLLVGAEFFGLLGMFLAAPVAAIIRDLVRLYYIRPRECAKRAARAKKQDVQLIDTSSAG
jgi:predicted PurR-regulated permease PerM